MAIHPERDVAVQYLLSVSYHTFFQPDKFRLIVVEGYEEHVIPRYETEYKGGIRLFLRHHRGCHQQEEDRQEHQPLQHIMYDSGKLFGGDILPVQEVGKLVLGQLLLHLYILVDAAHHGPLALMQPAAATIEGYGKSCDGKQGRAENNIQVHLFHVIAVFCLNGTKVLERRELK